MAFDAEAAEQWYQARQTRRQADTDDPRSLGRLRNTQRSFWEKEYAGGPLRGPVSDRRAEWMGGGAGGRMGEDWRQLKPIDAERHGSGLDPYTHALVKGVKQKFNKVGRNQAAKRVLKDQTAKAESANLIAGMREWRNQPEEAVTEEAPAATTVEAAPAPKSRPMEPPRVAGTPVQSIGNPWAYDPRYG